MCSSDLPSFSCADPAKRELGFSSYEHIWEEVDRRSRTIFADASWASRNPPAQTPGRHYVSTTGAQRAYLADMRRNETSRISLRNGRLES